VEPVTSKVNWRTNEAGQSLVEVAISLPLLLLLLLGAMEFGQLYYVAIEVTNAAHAGAQYGAQNKITASDNAGMQSLALADGVNVSGLSATTSHYCSCSNGLSSTCQPTDCTGALILEYVEVDTSATTTPRVHFPGSPTTFTTKGKAILRVQQ